MQELTSSRFLGKFFVLITVGLMAMGILIMVFAIRVLPSWTERKNNSLVESSIQQPPNEISNAKNEESAVYTENFESGEAVDWELEPGWQVIQDEGNYLLAGSGHTWARSRERYPGDYRLRFRLKLIQGGIHLVYRMNSIGRYYIGLAEGRAYLFKQIWPDTFIDLPVEIAAFYEPDDWNEFEIIGEGATIRLIINGNQAWEFTDTEEPLLYGSFAFETLSDDSQAYIDDIEVYSDDAIPEAAAGQYVWVRTGGPLGGLGYDIRMRPDNPDIMFVTDAWAGVFKSTDGGQTWFPANTGIDARTGESGDAVPIFCLTIDPHNHDMMWAGTQDMRGIFKSVDGGQTWQQKDNGIKEAFGITFRGFTIDPRSSDIVYAAAEISSWIWAGEGRDGREFDMVQGVVYRTIDGGENWEEVWRGNNLARYVWIDPRNPDVMYISTGIFDREAANSIPDERIPGGEGILKSTDGGKTWQQINKGLNNLYVGSLFMHPENPDILLAGTGNNQYYDDNGVYLSTDGGQSWQQTLDGDNITAVEFALSNPDIAYAGSAGAIYRSEDGGQTWQRMTGDNADSGWGPPGVRAGFPIDFQIDPRNPDRIFANEYGGGNFVSEDRGVTWAIASSGYTGAQTRDIVVDPENGSRVFAAARSGLFLSADGGNSWSGLNYPPAASMEWNTVALDPADSQHLLASNNWNSVLLESHDGGNSWNQATPFSPDGMNWRVITFAPSDSQIVYAGMSAYYSAGSFSDELNSAGLFISRDGGASWQPINDENTRDANIIAIAVAADNPEMVYAAAGNKGLFKSTNAGQTWNVLNLSSRSSAGVISVAIHPTDSVRVFAGLRQGGLLYSSDAGMTWEISGIGLDPEAHISDIVFDPTNPDIIYVADRFSGVYRSEDGGQTWFAINEGLSMRSVNALAISSDGRYLYAASEGGGVFSLDIP